MRDIGNLWEQLKPTNPLHLFRRLEANFIERPPKFLLDEGEWVSNWLLRVDAGKAFQQPAAKPAKAGYYTSHLCRRTGIYCKFRHQ